MRKASSSGARHVAAIAEHQRLDERARRRRRAARGPRRACARARPPAPARRCARAATSSRDSAAAWALPTAAIPAVAARRARIGRAGIDEAARPAQLGRHPDAIAGQERLERRSVEGHEHARLDRPPRAVALDGDQIDGHPRAVERALGRVGHPAVEDPALAVDQLGRRPRTRADRRRRCRSTSANPSADSPRSRPRRAASSMVPDRAPARSAAASGGTASHSPTAIPTANASETRPSAEIM